MTHRWRSIWSLECEAEGPADRVEAALILGIVVGCRRREQDDVAARYVEGSELGDVVPVAAGRCPDHGALAAERRVLDGRGLCAEGRRGANHGGPPLGQPRALRDTCG